MTETFFEVETSKLNDGAVNGTGKVTNYMVENFVVYPCVILHGGTRERSVLQLLKGMVTGSVSRSNMENYFSMYLNTDGVLLNLGKMNKMSLRPLITSDLFASFDVNLCVSETEQYSGDFLFAFCA